MIRILSVVESIILSLSTTVFYVFGASDRQREITEEYPDRVSARMPEDLPNRFRGFLKNDIQICSGCRFCSQVCPVDCIQIATEPGPEKNLSWVAEFVVDHSECIFCGLCVEICPTKSLVHTREYQGAEELREKLRHDFGRGHATEHMIAEWRQEQDLRESRSQEQVWDDRSPVGSEIRRRTQEG